jgi:hypothetical protein
MALHSNPKTPPLARRNGRSIVPNRSAPEATVASKSKQAKTRRHRRLRIAMVDRLSPIDRNLKPPYPVSQNSRKPEDTAACASRRAIGDNGSTLQPEYTAACASRRAIGDNGSTLKAKVENSGPFLHNLNVFLATYSAFCSLYIGRDSKTEFPR